jgi:thioesterase domain-containing protein
LKLPLFWVPGGRALSALTFRETSLLLGADRPVYAFESMLPAAPHEFEPVAQRAAAYLECLRHIQPHGPYQIAGFCLGGLVAYEMAHRLHEAGETVSFLGLVNSYFPSYGNGVGYRLRYMLARVAHQIRVADAAGLVKGVKRSATAAWVTWKRNLAAALLRSTSEPDTLRAAEFLDTETLNARVMANYQPPRYDGPVTVFICSQCEFDGLDRSLDPRLGWRRAASQAREIRVHGGHASILEYPFVEDFAASVRQCLESGTGME